MNGTTTFCSSASELKRPANAGERTFASDVARKNQVVINGAEVDAVLLCGLD